MTNDKIKITPEAVVEAYKKHGKKPAFKKFGDFHRDGRYDASENCCALSVLAIGQPYVEGGSFFSMFDLQSPWSFVRGFDGGCDSLSNTEYALGVACREAVLEAFPDTV